MSVKEIIRLSCDSGVCEYKVDYQNRRAMNAVIDQTAWVTNEYGDFCSQSCWDRYRQEKSIPRNAVD
jgi:hypothetical protein